MYGYGTFETYEVKPRGEILAKFVPSDGTTPFKISTDRNDLKTLIVISMRDKEACSIDYDARFFRARVYPLRTLFIGKSPALFHYSVTNRYGEYSVLEDVSYLYLNDYLNMLKREDEIVVVPDGSHGYLIDPSSNSRKTARVSVDLIKVVTV